MARVQAEWLFPEVQSYVLHGAAWNKLSAPLRSIQALAVNLL